jgi:hypothetical protein
MVRRRWQTLPVLLALSAQVGCDPAIPTGVPTPNPEHTFTELAHILVPIMDLDSAHYGLPGYFYSGSNIPPSEHSLEGAAQARAILPLDPAGQVLAPPIGGRFVFMSIGFSNTRQKWCTKNGTDGVTCDAWTFMGKAKVHTQVRKLTGGLRTFNGASRGAVTTEWDDPADPEYDRVRTILQAQGLSELQVQVIYLEIFTAHIPGSLPSDTADVWHQIPHAANQLRAIKVRYPNIRQVFLAPRDFSGFSNNYRAAEPHAYETGFAVKHLVMAQIHQLATGEIDSIAGDLSLAVAPWITWGPYMWATNTPRLDGLFWIRNDFETDGFHHSKSGETKAANCMITWFLNNQFSRCWFLKNQVCP